MTEISHAQANKEQESCRSCLYTGVATCIGLSGYFFYLANEEDGHRTMKQPRDGRYHGGTTPQKIPNMGGGDANAAGSHRTKSLMKNIKISILNFMQGHPVAKQNRPFLLGLSAFCAGAGAYRLYLN